MTTPHRPVDAATVAQARDYLDRWLPLRVVSHREVGLQVAIRVGRELCYSEAFGTADGVTPLTTRHLGHVASQSKSFTSTLALLLARDGVLRLDDTVGSRVVELADSPISDVTLRDLLGHGGGIVRDSSAADFWQLRRPFPSEDELIGLLSREGGTYGSREWFKYSNMGYALAGLMCARAAGTDYETLVRDRIVARIGETDIYGDFAPPLADRMSVGHMAPIGDAPRRPVAHTAANALAPATGVVATAESLSGFFGALVDRVDPLLSSPDQRLQRRTEHVITRHGKDIGRYGLGTELETVGERSMFGHSGGYPGYNSLSLADPDDGLVVSVIANQVPCRALDVVASIVAIVDAAVAPAEHPGDVAPDLPGRYRSLWGVLDVVELGENHLLADPLADRFDPDELRPTDDPDVVQVPEGHGFGAEGEKIRVLRHPDGSLDRMSLGGQSWWPWDRFDVEFPLEAGPA